MSTPKKSSVAEPVDESVRERLLTAALTIINTKGYEAASVREIVAAAGVTKPTLYYLLQEQKWNLSGVGA